MGVLIGFTPADDVDADNVSTAVTFDRFLPYIDLQSVALCEQDVDSLRNGVGVMDAISVKVEANFFCTNTELLGEADNFIDDTSSLRSRFGRGWVLYSQQTHLLGGRACR
ncbi:hypothetical protein D3C72_1811940 [compost metagenome]